jgi:hypothetical protein
MTVAVQERREAAAATGAELRARMENSHRREAARTLVTTSAGNRCSSCQGPVVHGQTVRVAHAPGCRRRAAMVAAAPRLAARLCAAVSMPVLAVPSGSQPAQVPVPAAEPPGAGPVRLEGRERHPHRQRSRPRREGVYTSQAPAMAEAEEARRREQEIDRAEEQETGRHGGIRPWVVLRWFVSGCRVTVEGWLATARRIVCGEDGRLKVWVDFDDGWMSESYDILTGLALGGLRAALAWAA